MTRRTAGSRKDGLGDAAPQPLPAESGWRPLDEAELRERAERLVAEGRMPDPELVAQKVREAIVEASEAIRRMRSEDELLAIATSGTISDDLAYMLKRDSPHLTDEQIAYMVSLT